MKPLPSLMVAPNGARLQKSDHPALPITIEEMVETAVQCAAAGADGLHLHIRDEQGNHLLDVAQYQRALTALSTATPDLRVQITTEAIGRYEAATQRQIALETGAEMVSCAVRELLRDGPEQFADFNIACQQNKIAIQHILYDLEDCELLEQHLPKELFISSDLQLIFVLGRYADAGASSPAELDPFLQWMGRHNITPDWAVCAFGRQETAVLLHAAKLGGKCRIGFENSLYMADGCIAKHNAEKVTDFLRARAKLDAPRGY